MDKTTKAFVIAACSVVIATPVVWVGLQVVQQMQINAARVAAEKKAAAEAAETNRQLDRLDPCREIALSKYKDQYAAFLTKCVVSALPIDQVQLP